MDKIPPPSLHLYTEEEAGRCAEEISLRREYSAMANPKISAEAKPSLHSRSLELCAQASAGVKSLDRLYRTCPP